jgi:hypothetical protein
VRPIARRRKPITTEIQINRINALNIYVSPVSCRFSGKIPENPQRTGVRETRITLLF